jgi:hypothetical protein
MLPNDMRYRGLCRFPGCSRRLGDWSLHVPPDKQLCFNHRHWSLVKEVEGYATRRSETSQSKPPGVKERPARSHNCA